MSGYLIKRSMSTSWRGCRPLRQDWLQSDPATLKSQLGWPSLECRHNYLKLCLCRRIISGESLIPQAVFAPHPSTLLRHINSCPIFLPHVRTLPQALILCGCVERYPSPHYHYPVCVWLQEAFTIVHGFVTLSIFSPL